LLDVLDKGALEAQKKANKNYYVNEGEGGNSEEKTLILLLIVK